MSLQEYWTEKGEFSKEKAETFANLVVEKFRTRGKKWDTENFSEEGLQWLRNFLVVCSCYLFYRCPLEQNRYSFAKLFACALGCFDEKNLRDIFSVQVPYSRDVFSILVEWLKEEQKENDLVLELIKTYENTKKAEIINIKFKLISLIEILEELEKELEEA